MGIFLSRSSGAGVQSVDALPSTSIRLEPSIQSPAANSAFAVLPTKIWILMRVAVSGISWRAGYSAKRHEGGQGVSRPFRRFGPRCPLGDMRAERGRLMLLWYAARSRAFRRIWILRLQITGVEMKRDS